VHHLHIEALGLAWEARLEDQYHSCQEMTTWIDDAYTVYKSRTKKS